MVEVVPERQNVGSTVSDEYSLLLAKLQKQRRTYRTVEELRAAQDAPSLRWTTPDTWTTTVEGGTTIVWPRGVAAAGEATLVYFHGGGFVSGRPRGYMRLAEALAASIGASKIAMPQYRLGPEYPFPIGEADCAEAYRAVVDRVGGATSLVVAGDSAGANLAAHVLSGLPSRENVLPAAVVLLSPWAMPSGVRDRTDSTDRDPLVSVENLSVMARWYLRDLPPASADVVPRMGDSRFPPTLVHVGGDEVLRPDAELLVDALRRNGTSVSLQVWPGMSHVWHLFLDLVPEAIEAVNEIGAFVSRLPWPGTGTGGDE